MNLEYGSLWRMKSMNFTGPTRKESFEQEKTVAALAQALRVHDKATFEHSERVAHYAALFSQALELPVEQVHLLWLAGLLHDVGKIGVQKSILQKSGPLDPEEYRHIQTHALLSAQILKRVNFTRPIPSLRSVTSIVLHHHERYDGTGYPDRLAGRSIPWGARLLAVVDTFDAMTADRSYRRACTIERALEVLQQGAGSQWDPALVTDWVEWVRQGWVQGMASDARELHGHSLHAREVHVEE